MLEGQSPSPAPAVRKLSAKDALSYLDFIKTQFPETTYDAFLDIMKAYKNSELTITEVAEEVSSLFAGDEEALSGFSVFLPPGHPSLASGPPTLPSPRESSTPETATFIIHRTSNDFPTSAQTPNTHFPAFPSANATYTFTPIAPSIRSPAASLTPDQHALPTPPDEEPVAQPVCVRDESAETEEEPEAVTRARGDPMFVDALGFVNVIKRVYGGESQVYRRFLNVLSENGSGNMTADEVYAEICVLFHGQPVLIENFLQFLPEEARTRLHPSTDPDAAPILVSSSDPPLPRYSPPSKTSKPAPSETTPTSQTTALTSAIGAPPSYRRTLRKKVSFSEPVVAGAQSPVHGSSSPEGDYERDYDGEYYHDGEYQEEQEEEEDSGHWIYEQHIDIGDEEDDRHYDDERTAVNEFSPLLIREDDSVRVTVDDERHMTGGEGKYGSSSLCTKCRTQIGWGGEDEERDLEEVRRDNEGLRWKYRGAVITAVAGWGLFFIVVGWWAIDLV
ncbi:Transcriptional regulatory protein sin3 [Rhizophlyctis rosea]|uniref:Transcriptional regulatory protein sin3 n=1 Tax=Rhizophlyctis rosea TaxID=64517 RepID=A0AAD5SEG0_9FUNG|nr:Transcriptional regulatory protein sin3 [Rhizophlyctis rosea]